MNPNKLKAAMVLRGLKVKEVSDLFGVSKQTFYRKLQAPEKLTIKEVKRLKDILGLTNEEAIDIFLT